MNKILFDAKIYNMYSPDYQYLQDTIEDEVKKMYRQTIQNPDVSAIIKGFNLAVSIVDPTKIQIYHEDNWGGLISADTNIIETQDTMDLIEASDNTVGVENYVYIRLYKGYGTYNKSLEVVEEDEQKNIDLYDFTKTYDRELDKWEVKVYTQAEVLALTTDELDQHVCLGSFTANGGSPITAISESGRVYAKTFIQKGSIDLDMLSSTGFLLPQYNVDNSDTVDDRYTGTPTDLQDDLNKIRTMIREIKQTGTWDFAFAGVEAGDRGLYRMLSHGLLDFGDNFSYEITDSLQLTITQGKALIDDSVETIEASIDYGVFDITEGHKIYVENEPHNTPGIGLTFTLDNAPISADFIRINEDITGYEYIQGVDYEITDYGHASGQATIKILSVTMAVDAVLVDYYYGHPRIDIIAITSTGFSLKEGTPASGPIPPNLAEGEIPLYYISVPGTASSLDEGYIIDSRHMLELQRKTVEIVPTDLACYNDYTGSLTSTGYNRYNHWGVEQLTMSACSITSSTGRTLARGEGWDLDDATYSDVLGDYFISNSSDGVISVTDTGNVFIRSIIYTNTDDELWVWAFPKDEQTTLTLKYESVPGSNVFDVTRTIYIPTEPASTWDTSMPNRRINPSPTPILLGYGFTKGYHKIEIGVTTGKLFFNRIMVGRLDTFYNHKDNGLFSSRLYTEAINFIQTAETGTCCKCESTLMTVGGKPVFHTTAQQGVYIGVDAGNTVHNTEGCATDAERNTAIGYASLYNTDTGCDNTAIGWKSLCSNTTGDNNIAIGKAALCSSSTTNDNIAIGKDAMCSNLTGCENVAIGTDAMQGNLSGCKNIAIGNQALNANQCSSDHIAIGYKALTCADGATTNIAIGTCSQQATTNGSSNIAVGKHSEYNNTVGVCNIAIGGCTLNTNCSGSCNIAIGQETLYSHSNVADTVAVGHNALRSNSTGTNNTALGTCTLRTNTCGSENIGVGNKSLYCNTEGNCNVGIGTCSMYSNTTACYNTGVGAGTLVCNMTGCKNTAVGRASLYSNTGNDNTSFGATSLYCNTSGENNSAFGSDAMCINTTGCYNTAIGYHALCSNVCCNDSTAIGYCALASATCGGNTAVGSCSLRCATTGVNNTAVGRCTLASNVCGYNNVAVGDCALASETRGYNLIAIGYKAGYSQNGLGCEHHSDIYIGGCAGYNLNTCPGANVVIGGYALNCATSSYANVVVGYAAGANMVSGDHNVIIGMTAAENYSSGCYNVIIGRYALSTGGHGGTCNVVIGSQALFNGPSCFNNVIMIGASAFATQSNQVFIGNPSITCAVLRSTAGIDWSLTSDERVKKNIRPLDYCALCFINDLKPIYYTPKHASEVPNELKQHYAPDGEIKEKPEDFDNIISHGLTAQDVSSTIKKLGICFNGVHYNKDDSGDLASISYGSFIVPLIKAVQELNSRVEELEKLN